MRTPLIAGNWKMNGSRAMAAELCKGIAEGANSITNAEIAICPPFILIPAAAAIIDNTPVKLGAQDVDTHGDGAYTGQISTSMLRDAGCHYVIVGHSERRALYGESDALVAEKTKAVLTAGMTAIVCVGETLEERESGATEDVVARQYKAVLDVNGIESFNNIVIAYEPVWAIGTGKTATPEQAQAVHAFIRAQMSSQNNKAAQNCRILYGGSMKPDNASTLISQQDIDGGLIGGASLTASDFLAICAAA